MFADHELDAEKKLEEVGIPNFPNNSEENKLHQSLENLL